MLRRAARVCSIYIASGDFLTRNTERRVEVGVRIDDPEIAKKLRGILDLQLRDTVNARVMLPDGTYVKVKPEEGQPPVDSQMAMYGYFQHGWDTPAKTVKATAHKTTGADARRESHTPKKGNGVVLHAVPRHFWVPVWTRQKVRSRQDR